MTRQQALEVLLFGAMLYRFDLRANLPIDGGTPAERRAIEKDVRKKDRPYFKCYEFLYVRKHILRDTPELRLMKAVFGTTQRKDARDEYIRLRESKSRIDQKLARAWLTLFAPHRANRAKWKTNRNNNNKGGSK